MESTPQEVLVENSFDFPPSSEVFNAIPASRFWSPPAPESAQDRQGSQGNLQKDFATEMGSKYALKKQQPKIQSHLTETIDSMSTVKLDSMPSLMVDALELLRAERFAADVEDTQLFGCAQSLLLLPSLLQRKTLASEATKSNVSGHLSMTVGESIGTPDHAPPSSVAVTTLMIRNLPCKLSQEGLAQAIDELGFVETYDLVYMPRGSSSSIGYGFVNFRSPEAASRFSCLVASGNFGAAKDKPVFVTAAKHQGFLGALQAIAKGNNFRRRSQRPLIFQGVL